MRTNAPSSYLPSDAAGLRSRPAAFLLRLYLLSLSWSLFGCAENPCMSSNAVTCAECLSLGKGCAWCTQKDFMVESLKTERCDFFSNLINKGCRSDLIEFPSFHVTVSRVPDENTQVTPKEVAIHLRPGAEANLLVKVHRLKKYPVDLYYLVDVSASMHASINKLQSIGFDLAQKMAEFSSDFRLGFGSFVDKAVTPYISIHPDRIDNQCSLFQLECMRPHGYIHVLPLTDNVTEFKSTVSKQKFSANIDAPEGVFDAMLQAAVCLRQIGWRKDAKRVLLVMTDQSSHLALDSKLAGIVVPNDGLCHLKDNEYTRSAHLEHPSLGQLSEKLIENDINVVFAVEKDPFRWYKDLMPLLPGTVAKDIKSGAANLEEIVIDAYQTLLSEVKTLVVNNIQGLHVNVTAICPDGTRKKGAEGCTNVKSNEEVLLNITLMLNTCDVGEGENYIIIKPIGFNETAKIMVHVNCSCPCNGNTWHNGQCVDTLSQDEQTQPSIEIRCDATTVPQDSCKLSRGRAVCSGRGVCECDKCLCHKTKLGKIYGKYCEMDTFSCPHHDGQMCNGHGECEDGECRCFSGWEGVRCECSSSTERCVKPQGELCSGRGTCTCGQCVCSDPGTFGPFCEYCTTCSNARGNNWNCLQCHVSNNMSQTMSYHCKTSCTRIVYYLDHTLECFSDSSLIRIFFIIVIITFLIGLLNLLIIRQIILHWSNNRIKTSAHYRGGSARKDNANLPTIFTRTPSYRLEKREEIKIETFKFEVHEKSMCKL